MNGTSARAPSPLLTRTARAQAAAIVRAMNQVTGAFWKPVNGTAMRFAGGFVAWLFLWWILIFFVMAKAAVYVAILLVLALALAGVLAAGLVLGQVERRHDRAIAAQDNGGS